MTLIGLALALQVGEVMQAFAERMELARTAAEEQAAVAATLEALHRIPSTDPDAARAEFHVAEMLMYQGKAGDSADAFLAFRERHPRDPNAEAALLGAAGMREEEEKFDEAIGLYRRHGSPEADRQAAMCLLYAGRGDEAIDTLRAMENWEATLRLALVEHVLGRNEECRATLTALRRECPEREMVEAAGALLETFRALDRPLPALRVGDFSTEAAIGRVLVLYMYSALAPEAPIEAATMKRLHGRAGVTVAGICVDAVPEALERYRERFAPGWTLAHDPFGKACAAALGRSTPPLVIVADAEGNVRYLQLSGRDLETAVRRLLK